MKNDALFLAAVALFGMGEVAHANESIEAANTEIGLSMGGQNIAYHEVGLQSVGMPQAYNWAGGGAEPDGWLDSQVGTMPAFSIALSRQGDLLGLNNVYLSAVVTGAVGNTKYGTYGWTPHYAANNQGMWETYGPIGEADQDFAVDGSFKIGRAFELGQRAQITPYVTFGGRVWSRNVSWFYGDDYYWHLAGGVGVLAQYAVTPRLVVGLDASAQEAFSANAHEGGVDFPLGSRPMLAGALTADYRLTKHLHATASYSVQRIRYGNSPGEGPVYGGAMPGDPTYQSMEPQSRTVTQTVLVGMAYSF